MHYLRAQAQRKYTHHFDSHVRLVDIYSNKIHMWKRMKFHIKLPEELRNFHLSGGTLSSDICEMLTSHKSNGTYTHT